MATRFFSTANAALSKGVVNDLKRLSKASGGTIASQVENEHSAFVLLGEHCFHMARDRQREKGKKEWPDTYLNDDRCRAIIGNAVLQGVRGLDLTIPGDCLLEGITDKLIIDLDKFEPKEQELVEWIPTIVLD